MPTDEPQEHTPLGDQDYAGPERRAHTGGTALANALPEIIRKSAEGAAEGGVEGAGKIGAFGLFGKVGQAAQLTASGVIIFLVFVWDSRSADNMTYMREQLNQSTAQRDRDRDADQRRYEQMFIEMSKLSAAVNELAAQSRAANTNITRATILLEEASRRVERAAPKNEPVERDQEMGRLLQIPVFGSWPAGPAPLRMPELAPYPRIHFTRGG